MMPDINDLFDSFTQNLPNLNWTATHGATALTVTKATTGTDLARGPWVKFDYTEAGGAHNIQGYFLFVGGERIKFDGTKEADNDDMRMAVDGDGFIVNFSGSLQGQAFDYRFVGTP